MAFKERQLKEFLNKEGWEDNPNDTYPFYDKKNNQELVRNILKYRLQDRGHKLTPELESNFIKRFQPAFSYGTGDGLVYDTKTKKFTPITHEGKIENILPELKKEDWWKETGLDKLNIKPLPWYKRILN